MSNMDPRFSTFLDPPRLSKDKSRSAGTDDKITPTKMKEFLSRLFNIAARRSPSPSEEKQTEKENEIGMRKASERNKGDGTEKWKGKREGRDKFTSEKQPTNYLWSGLPNSNPKSEKPLATPRTVKQHPAPKSGTRRRSGNTTCQTSSTLPNSNSIAVPPPPVNVPSYTIKDIFFNSKGKPVSSSRRSKFRSLSSLPSLKTLNTSPSSSNTNTPPTTSPSSTTSTTSTTATSTRTSTPLQSTHLALTLSQFAHLKSQLRRTTRRLQQQEQVTSNLSTNLHYILTRKSTQLSTTLASSRKRLRKAQVQNMLSTLSKVKEHSRRLFLRKSACLSRSFAAVSGFGNVVDEAAGEALPDAGSGRRVVQGGRYVLRKEAVRGLVQDLRRDIRVQRRLDKELMSSVLDRAREGRWQSHLGEVVMMGRFVEFLEGRGRMMEGCYVALESLARGFEGLGSREERGC